MTVLHREARRPRELRPGDGFEVSYVPDDGAERRVPLAHLWPAPRRLSTGCGGSEIRKRRTRRDRATPSVGGGALRPCTTVTPDGARHDGGAPIICVIAARIFWRASGSVIRRRDSSVR